MLLSKQNALRQTINTYTIYNMGQPLWEAFAVWSAESWLQWAVDGNQRGLDELQSPFLGLRRIRWQHPSLNEWALGMFSMSGHCKITHSEAWIGAWNRMFNSEKVYNVRPNNLNPQADIDCGPYPHRPPSRGGNTRHLRVRTISEDKIIYLSISCLNVNMNVFRRALSWHFLSSYNRHTL